MTTDSIRVRSVRHARVHSVDSQLRSGEYVTHALRARGHVGYAYDRPTDTGYVLSVVTIAPIFREGRRHAALD